MNVLLIRPPARYASGAISPSINLPLGLLSIAATLEREGHAVSLYDAQLQPDDPVTEHHDHVIMGASWDEVEKEIAGRSADLIGISCPFSTQLAQAVRLAAVARRAHPAATIVVGGPPASVQPADFLGADSPVDLVCIGEGELTMVEIAAALAAPGLPDRIPGTAHHFAGKLTVNARRGAIEQLDDLPLPAYHLVRLEDYFDLFARGFTDRPTLSGAGAQRSMSLITSRGCPFGCVFCSIDLHMGKRWRGNSVGYVLKHVELLVERYGVRHIHFEDDNISFSPERFAGILRGLQQLPGGITWDTPNGVRVDTLTRDLVRLCKESGCAYLVFGVESGNKQVLDTIVQKKLDLEAVRSAASWCHEIGLDTMAFYVLGFPGETPLQMADTVALAMDLLGKYYVTPLLFVATPLPGTRLERTFLERGLLAAPLGAEELAAMTQGGLYLDGGTFSAEQLQGVREEFFRRYRKVFALSTVRFLLGRPSSLLMLGRLLCNGGNAPLKQRLIALMSVKNVTLVGAKG